MPVLPVLSLELFVPCGGARCSSWRETVSQNERETLRHERERLLPPAFFPSALFFFPFGSLLPLFHPLCCHTKKKTTGPRQ